MSQRTNSPVSGAERELVAQAQTGDAGAFEDLVRRHESRVRGLACHLCRGNGYDGDDAAQNALFQAYLHLPDFRGDSSFSSWMMKIVINECRAKWRSEKRHAGSFAFAELSERIDGHGAAEVPEKSANPEEQYSRNELRRLLLKAVHLVDGLHQEVVLLHDLSGMSIRETAAALGLSEAATKSRVLRARRQLRRKLRELMLCRTERSR